MIKMTQKAAVIYAIENLVDAPADVVEKLQSIVTSLDKKAGADRKPTATQLQNKVYEQEIVDYMSAHPKAYTVSQLIAEVASLATFSTPKVSALANALVTAGVLTKGKEGRSTVFTLAA